ncbi:MAG TPA: SpoIID/LytB domain-containing protein [Bacteroidales bacterium]|nr:MAG: Amidase enhancer precursor [Bacteroidetes bacterium ADurb.Bin145]HOU01319.1 SpoIID/LytB domain-containing protein [Bacteroidales bacterium]HQG63961.1 SpoIID/LytB domain-containing protein [Bacteroidales bacterium]HQK67402.1 SpoIID/LytB domain-containing protein [Bacteroidales bacterium]
MNSPSAEFRIIALCILVLHTSVLQSQLRIRIFADKSPGSVLFSVTVGEYSLTDSNGRIKTMRSGESAIISRFNSGLAVKTNNDPAFICDSVHFSATDSKASFSVRINSDVPQRQYYTGDLICYPDLGTVVMINLPDIDSYLAGVVRAEGGSGKHIEYLKTQAIIARTYMYKYLHKHTSDRYNLCDNTHCQAFNGVINDSLIVKAVRDTRDLVILGRDSVLIISAFHSNCGGETASSGDVWLTGQPYLKSVKDPYCNNSRNARWKKVLSLNDWISYLNKSGLKEKPDEVLKINFAQSTRKTDYMTGNFSLPLQKIRDDLDLRSTFFSVRVEGDSVILDGKGYGHGVGLCQEGAMAMAEKGFDYRQIIYFYFEGVIISDINNAVQK